MKKVLLMALVMIASSCGLFNKTVNKRKLERSESARIEVSKSLNESVSVSGIDFREGGKISSVPGKTGSASGKLKDGVGIITDSAGLLLVALIDSLSGNLTVAYNIPGGYHADYWRGISGRDSSAGRSADVDSTGSHKSAEVTSSLIKDRKPSFGGTIAMWIGGALLAMAAIWAIAKFVMKR